MTPKPTTLEAALAWLNAMGHFGRILLWVELIEVRACGHAASVNIDNESDIPAAIVAATQQVYDTIHGEAK